MKKWIKAGDIEITEHALDVMWEMTERLRLAQEEQANHD